METPIFCKKVFYASINFKHNHIRPRPKKSQTIPFEEPYYKYIEKFDPEEYNFPDIDENGRMLHHNYMFDKVTYEKKDKIHIDAKAEN